MCSGGGGGIDGAAGHPISVHPSRRLLVPVCYADVHATLMVLSLRSGVVCLERTPDSPESHQMNGEVDSWFAEVFDMLKDRCHLIHARVGYEEG